MGCGISKSDPEDANPTCEFNPAIARQKNVRPIDEDPDVGSDQADQHGQKSITLPVKDDGLVKEPAAVKENKMEKERELEMKEVEDEKEKEIANKVSEKAVAEEEGLHHQEEIRVDSHRHNEEEEKEVSDEREDSRNIAPGSPSFREYCVDWDSEGSGTGNSGEFTACANKESKY
uniref:Uncharacterized protein n=1 Tax=Fagus sylvatica TaxID=28930 RepID=A0A2N9HMN4_FAGSY